MLLENEIIDYVTNKNDIIHWTTLKGEYRYLIVIGFLKSKNILCNWENVTYYIKYDKRLLINSFKYIIILEELFKSFIVRNKKVTSGKVKNFGFRTSVDEFLSLGDKANYDGIDLELLKVEKNKIIEFRNKVVHNKILLNSKDTGENSLENIFKIFVRILPMSYRDGFINDINSSAKGILDKSWHIELNNN